jgi:uncharacterized protein (UPF0297 family)
MAMDCDIKPRAIYFEYCQIKKVLSKERLDDVYASLRNNGYRWIHDLKNTLAIRA